jgi:phosphoserine phosphatase
MCIESFEHLVALLKGFYRWDNGRGEYDFAGAVALFAATLDGLRTNALQSEIEEIGERLREEQAAFLRRLVGYLEQA